MAKKILNCKSCGTETLNSTKVCPSCGTKRNFFARHKVLTVLIVLILFGSVMPKTEETPVKDAVPAVAAEQTQKEEVKAPVVLNDGEKVILKMNYSDMTKDQVGIFTDVKEKFSNLEDAAKQEYQADYDRILGQETRAKNIENQFSLWDGSHKNLSEAVKASMNDPKSYEHVSTVYWDKGDYLVVRTTFRGTNAFGGVVTNTVTAEVGLDGSIIRVLEE